MAAITMRTATCIIALAIVAVPAIAQTSEEVIDRVESPTPWSRVPADFRGAPFGGTLDHLKAALGDVKCSDMAATSINSWYAPVDHVRCEPANRMIIAGKRMNESYLFVAGKLQAIRIAPPGLSFAQVMSHVPTAMPFGDVRTAFVDRYGEPTLQIKTRVKGNKDETIYTGVGRRIQIVPWEAIKETVSWVAPNALTVKLTEDIHGGFDEAWLFTPEWTAALDAAKKARAKTTPF